MLNPPRLISANTVSKPAIGAKKNPSERLRRVYGKVMNG